MADDNVDEAAQPHRLALPVRLRTVTRPEDSARVEASTVHCPVIQGSRSVDHCQRCSHFRGMTVGEGRALIHCQPPIPRAAAITGLAEALHTTANGELLGAEVICLDCELPASKASTLLQARGSRSAPVVDDHGVLVGVVEATALERVCAEEAQALRGFAFGATASEVEDAMTTHAVSLSESASVAQAARLMVALGLESVPVVSQDQRVVGVLTAMDLLRWLVARSDSREG